jgi:serine/threonine protein phosphatase 1
LFQWSRKSSVAHSPKSATWDVADGEHIYAVGDVHGCSDLLDAMIEKIGVDAKTRSAERRHRIIFLGDYIDRGDNSREVIERLLQLKRQFGARVEFLSGNHEAALLGFLKDPIEGRSWLDFGGKQTLASYGIAPLSITPDRAELVALRDTLRDAMGGHVAFLRGLSRLARSGDVLFVHAGLDPVYPVEAQPDAALFWGQIDKGDIPGLPGYRMVHGHYADREPVSEERRICVDTGAYFTGRLTAVRLDDEVAFLHVNVSDLMD